MGVRTNIDLAFQIGRNNDLGQLAFDGAPDQQILDTLAHETDGTITLAAGESNYVVPFGDVAQARIVYIEATGPIRVTPGGGLATSAQVDGSGGSYPTGFAGGENLDLEIDNAAVSVSFTSADQSLSDVINRINSAAALAGITDGSGTPATIARDNGSGQLRLESPTTGASSEVDIQASSAAAALTALGLTGGTVVNGQNASPGQTPLTLLVPSSVAAGGPSNARVIFLATLQTSALTIDNLDSNNAVEVVVAIAGDLLSSPPASSC